MTFTFERRMNDNRVVSSRRRSTYVFAADCGCRRTMAFFPMEVPPSIEDTCKHEEPSSETRSK